jgi:hypothetical protein
VLLRCSLSFQVSKHSRKNSLLPLSCPPESINEARIRRISMKFDMANFYENLSR